MESSNESFMSFSLHDMVQMVSDSFLRRPVTTVNRGYTIDVILIQQMSWRHSVSCCYLRAATFLLLFLKQIKHRTNVLIMSKINSRKTFPSNRKPMPIKRWNV